MATTFFCVIAQLGWGMLSFSVKVLILIFTSRNSGVCQQRSRSGDFYAWILMYSRFQCFIDLLFCVEISEYLDEAMLIPKNTSVLIRRVPGRPRMPIVAAPEYYFKTFSHSQLGYFSSI